MGTSQHHSLWWHNHTPPCLPFNKIQKQKKSSSSSPKGLSISTLFPRHLQQLLQCNNPFLLFSLVVLLLVVLSFLLHLFWQILLVQMGMCYNLRIVLQTKVEIVVTEENREGMKIVATVRELGASMLVVGLHDHSFLYR